MGILGDCLANTPLANTVAVWRIKKADTPIQDRLRYRGISLKPYYNSIWEQRIEAIKNANTKL